MTIKKSEIIDGIIVINKPIGVSSNWALQKVKYLLNAKKAGHTGNLDPMATGVLPICLGKATKVSPYLLNANKAYFGRIQLGTSTNTGDKEGQVITTSAPPKYLTKQVIEKTLKNFIGFKKQIPPMYSALKHNGKRLYELARQGITVDRPARAINIFSLKCLKYDPIYHTVDIKVKCSKGTYIRTLGCDIAKELGCVGHLSYLHRFKCGIFAEDDMHEISTLKDFSKIKINKLVNNIESIFSNQPILRLSHSEVKEFYHTGRLLPKVSLSSGIIKIYYQDSFIAIANFNNGVLIKKITFHEA